VNSDRSKCIMAGLGRYELSLLEKQFVGRVKEYIQENEMITEQQESILEGIYREKIRGMKKTGQGEVAYISKSAV
jgi:hypothetical protein